MCTVTWWRSEADNYGVCFNRDELRTRPTSEPVREKVNPLGTRFLCARDPEAGGTWLMANQHGLIAGVLNHYAAEASAARSGPSRGKRSRGEIPIVFGGCRDLVEAAVEAGRLRCGDFAPFILIVWDAVGHAAWVWDGAALRAELNLGQPVSTSSHRTPEVLAWRRERFRELVGGGTDDSPERERLMRYQCDTANADGAFNVRMRRPDARTESICRVEVNRAEVRFHHQREAPDALEALDAHEAAVTRV